MNGCTAIIAAFATGVFVAIASKNVHYGLAAITAIISLGSFVRELKEKP